MRLRETLYAVGSEKFNNWVSATLTERILNVWDTIAEHDHVVINFNDSGVNSPQLAAALYFVNEPLHPQRP